MYTISCNMEGTVHYLIERNKRVSWGTQADIMQSPQSLFYCIGQVRDALSRVISFYPELFESSFQVVEVDNERIIEIEGVDNPHDKFVTCADFLQHQNHRLLSDVLSEALAERETDVLLCMLTATYENEWLEPSNLTFIDFQKTYRQLPGSNISFYIYFDNKRISEDCLQCYIEKLREVEFSKVSVDSLAEDRLLLYCILFDNKYTTTLFPYCNELFMTNPKEIVCRYIHQYISQII